MRAATAARDVIFPGQVAQLVDLARRQGCLRAEDLRRELPIQLMTPEEIALVVTHLESVGIDVEVDEALFSPPRAPQLPPAAQDPLGEAPVPPASVQRAHILASESPTATTTTAPVRTGGSFTAHVAVAVAAVVSLGALFLYFVASGR